jgi:uncharacterized membrane protein
MPDSFPISTEIQPQNAHGRYLGLLVGGVATLVFVTWLLNTPEGLLGKADAVGYAVCHRIDGRSFHIGDHQFPLCARCTGMYLGALLGMVVMTLMGRGKAGVLPPRRVLFTLFAFVGLMGIDGVNSYATLFPGVPNLYQPQNWLRLVTGTLNGLALAGLIYPIVNQTLWKHWEERPALANGRELLVLLALAIVTIGMVLSGNVRLLYPLALLSALGVVAMLVALNTTIFLVVVRRENRAENWRGALMPLVAGFALAMTQIGLVDAARFAVFGTWGGLPLPG